MDSKEYLKNFVLVRFRSGGGRRTKKDKKLTSEVVINHGMQEGQANVSVKYFADGEFDTVDKLNRERRAAFKVMTVGWFDDSTGMIPAAKFVELDNKLTDYSSKIENAIDQKIADWVGVIERAKLARSGNFNPDDYPSNPSVLHDWYQARWTVVPHPSQSSLASGIADALESDVRSRLAAAQADMNDGIETMKEEIAQRLIGPLDALAAKCLEIDESGGDARKRVHRAMFKHILEAVDQLKAFLPQSEKLDRALAATEALAGAIHLSPLITKEKATRDKVRNLAEKSRDAVDDALKEVFA